MVEILVPAYTEQKVKMICSDRHNLVKTLCLTSTSRMNTSVTRCHWWIEFKKSRWRTYCAIVKSTILVAIAAILLFILLKEFYFAVINGLENIKKWESLFSFVANRDIWQPLVRVPSENSLEISDPLKGMQ